jgi:hypothetical protein
VSVFSGISSSVGASLMDTTKIYSFSVMGTWLVVVSSTASVPRSKEIFKFPCSVSTPAGLGILSTE